MTNRVMLILIFNVLICCLAMGFVLSLILLALDVSLYVVLYLAQSRTTRIHFDA